MFTVRTPGSVTLNAATAAALGGMVVGNTYEIRVFQAERHTVDSNYRLTLDGFVRARSVCKRPPPTSPCSVTSRACAHWEAVSCGSSFRWRASVPGTSEIQFRAATVADTQAALPATPAPAPTTVPIGTADPTNSPPGPTPAMAERHGWRGTGAGLGSSSERGNTSSKQWLRVFMTFVLDNNNSPRLDEWQQLYSCVPNE